jgi:hypothetical protein
MQVEGLGVVVAPAMGMALRMDMPDRMGVVMGMVVKGVERVIMWHSTTSAR